MAPGFSPPVGYAAAYEKRAALERDSRSSKKGWRSTAHASALADRLLIERQVLVDAHVAGQAQHALGDDVAQDLVAAAGDAQRRRIEQRLLEERIGGHRL